ncbi:LITAF domain-containing protein-like [Babylonia areolata]|uniref:LITAF domain-containing protein-like n=1 Tax=Babylonia areolata TaxID=304850 RepID=UPI003FD2A7C2
MDPFYVVPYSSPYHSGFPPAPPPPGHHPPPSFHPMTPASGTSMLMQAQPPPQTATPGNACSYRQLPVQIQCQHCGANVITSTDYRVGGFTCLMGFLIAVVGGVLGCCLIPCCVDGCKDVTHTCPFCNNTVGRFRRL